MFIIQALLFSASRKTLNWWEMSSKQNTYFVYSMRENAKPEFCKPSLMVVLLLARVGQKFCNRPLVLLPAHFIKGPKISISARRDILCDCPRFPISYFERRHFELPKVSGMGGNGCCRLGPRQTATGGRFNLAAAIRTLITVKSVQDSRLVLNDPRWLEFCNCMSLSK